MPAPNAQERTIEISAQLLSAVEEKLTNAGLEIRGKKRLRDLGWRMNCVSNGRPFRISFDPADNSIAVYENRWLFHPYLWGFSLESSDDIDVAANVALEVVAPRLNRDNHRPIEGWMPFAESITDANYVDLFATQETLVIHFWAGWNGIDPPADKELAAARENLPSVRYYACNIDENRKLPKELNVVSIPSFVESLDGSDPVPSFATLGKTKKWI